MAESRDEIAKLEALYANNPEGRVFTHLAEAYRKAGELDRARAILQEGLAKHPAYASAHVVLGRVLADQQNTDEAEEEFRRVLDLDPHNHVALRCLGDIARAAGRRDDALRYFGELRQLDPNNDELGRTIEELSASPAVTMEEPPPETPAEVASEAAQPEPEPEAEPEPEPEPEPSLPEQPEVPAFVAEGATEPEPDLEPEPEEDLGQDLEFDWVPSEEDQPEAGLPGDLGELAAVSTDLTTDLPAFDTPEDATTFADVDLSLGQQEPEPQLPTEPLTLAEPAEAAATPQPEETGEVLTETIAELYRAQGLYDRAADVYRALVEQRPDEAGLKEKLQEVEALARRPEPESAVEPEAWTPEPWETAAVSETVEPMAPAAPPFEPTAPEALEPEAAGEPEQVAESAEPEEAASFAAAAPEGPGDEAEAWIAGGTVAAESAPTPYAWDEQAQPGEPDGGPPIRDYFRRLLAWKPSVVQPAAPQAAAPEETAAPEAAEPEPAFEIETEPEPMFLLDEEMADTQQLFAEQSSAEETVEPWIQLPATQDEPAEPWNVAPTAAAPAEEPAPPPPPPSQPSPAQSHLDASAAFDEWFDAAAPAPPPEPAPAPQEEASTDEDDDLEMFRSWLQSLKK